MNNDIILREAEWYGQPAWILENACLRVVTVPGIGAKIVSIFDKKAQYEWLVNPGGRPFKPVEYGSVFIDQDMSGWDEMFPTIDECVYPGPGPYDGALVPDHGEVWSLPWCVDKAAVGELRLSVNGRALPYRLTRSMTLVADRTFHLGYELVNTGDAPFAGLWAAHPQFRVSERTEIRLPADIRQVVNVKDVKEWGATGLVYTWPEATTQQGQPVRLDRVVPATERRYRKFYTLPDQAVLWAALQEGSNWLRFEWDPQKVPYLGIWVDEGGFNLKPTVALEPSTGFYDILTLAVENGRIPTIAPGEQHTWHLTVQIGTK